MPIDFTVGNVSFTDFEAPPSLNDVGGKQVVAVHEFPGGSKSIQLLGALPKCIRWKGMMLGGSAISRHFAIKQLVQNAELVTLTFGEISFDGVVTDYKSDIRNRWEIDYECEFEPVDDNNAGDDGIPMPPSAADLLAQAAQSFSQQVATPASGYSFPSTVQAPASTLTGAISSTLAQNGFSLAGATVAQLTSLSNQISALRNTLAPLIAGTDPVATSAALEADTSLMLMQSAIDADLPPLAVISIVDPDLFSLASQYYGDPGLWQYIYKANSEALGVVPDPTPIGRFSLVIPSLNSLPVRS